MWQNPSPDALTKKRNIIAGGMHTDLELLRPSVLSLHYACFGAFGSLGAFCQCCSLTAELDDFKPIVSITVWLVCEGWVGSLRGVVNIAVMLSEEGGLATGHAGDASENRCKGGKSAKDVWYVWT